MMLSMLSMLAMLSMPAHSLTGITQSWDAKKGAGVDAFKKAALLTKYADKTMKVLLIEVCG
jgi:hypothetical protein